MFFDCDEFHSGRGRDITPPPNPIGHLVAWTEQVRALERAKIIFADTDAVINYEEGICCLVCESTESAYQVYRFLSDCAEELGLLPELAENRVFIHYHDFNQR